MANKLETWALPRLQQLLDLDEESLKQVITYADSLSGESAAEHLKNLLGDGAKSLDFISGFNLVRRQQQQQQQTPPSSAPASASTSTSASGSSNRPHAKAKKKANIHALPPRQVEGHGNTAGAYQKRSEEDDYLARPARQRHKDQVADNLALRQSRPDATQLPLITDSAKPTTLPITAKPPPSASGPLIEDSLSSRKNAATTKGAMASSRTASPAAKTKINISGGTAMHGASTALTDLDSAIRSLEVQTNPSLTPSAEDDLRRKCNCMATRHPLLDMAPNCLNCGKIICVKEGLAPCTFCKSPLLDQEDVLRVLRVLKDERGEERMKSNNAAHKKADVAHGKARAYTGRDFLAQASSSARSSPLSSTPATPAGSDDEATAKAKAHRDKLLGFQANNARRTVVHDEAADFDVPSAGTNMWASPQERAQQLKKQQRLLREMDWDAKPEYEKRQVVASIDLKAGKVVRRMAEIPRPDFTKSHDADDDDDQDDFIPPVNSTGSGAFSNNPLAAGLIRPTARKEEDKDGRSKDPNSQKQRVTWRRVQMDQDQGDNEQWILDGGVYGSQQHQNKNVPLGEEQHAYG